jgi:hypothetical protein
MGDLLSEKTSTNCVKARVSTRTLRLLRFASWLIALGIIVAVAWRIPIADVLGAIADGPFIAFAGYVVGLQVTSVMADTFATWVALRVVDIRRTLRTVAVARGATYILGLLNQTLSAGGFGLYLARSGEPRLHAAAVVFFLVTVYLSVVTAVALAGLALGAPEIDVSVQSSVLLAGLALSAGLFVLGVRPSCIANRAFFRPALSAGFAGYAVAGIARLPHVIVMVIGTWWGLRVWGISIPFGKGMTVIPILLLIATIPLTPSGLGAAQALQVAYFAMHAAGGTIIEREASVLAVSLYWHLLSVLAQGLIGLLALSALPRVTATQDGRLRSHSLPPS